MPLVAVCTVCSRFGLTENLLERGGAGDVALAVLPFLDRLGRNADGVRELLATPSQAEAAMAEL